MMIANNVVTVGEADALGGMRGTRREAASTSAARAAAIWRRVRKVEFFCFCSGLLFQASAQAGSDFIRGAAGYGHLQSHCHAIFVIGWSLLPSAGFGEGAQIVGCVGHHDGLTGPFEHVDVVPVVADGHGFFAIDAEAGGEALESPSFGDSWGRQVEDGEVARGIFGADGFTGAAPLAGFQGLLGLAHFVEATGDHALNRIVAIGEGVFERLDDFDGVAIGFDPKGDPVMCLFEVFEDEFAAPDVVEGEDQCSEGPEQAADAPRYACFEMERSMGSPPRVLVTAPLDVIRGMSARRPRPSRRGAV